MTDRSIITNNLGIAKNIKWGLELVKSFGSKVKHLEQARGLKLTVNAWYLEGYYRKINSKAICNSIC